MTLEPERYELREAPAYDFPLDRREFFKTLGGGLLIVALISPSDAQESGRRGGAGGLGAPKEIAAWIHVGEDGVITANTGKVEVGQNIRTSLSQAVAEELRIPVSSVRLVMGDTALTPYDMGTFGSLTTPQMAPQIHKASAAARQALIALAAKQWSADPATLTASDGRVIAPGGRSIGYGELTKGRKLVETVDGAGIAAPKDWKVCGQSIPKVDGRAFVTGAHQYVSDLHPAGMLFGKVLRPAGYGGKLASFDGSKAAAMPGVKVVRDGDFAGVTAPSQEAAERALEALKAEWKVDPQPSDRELFGYLKENASESRPSTLEGAVDQALAEAPVKLRRTYEIAYIAHTPLEPRAAVAEWSDGKLTAWIGTQRPFGVRSELAEAFHLPEDRIRVIMPDTGSGYGGKHTGEAAIEAARLAREAGQPVKVVWTRAEEFTWAYARPAGVIEIASGATKEGAIVAWDFHNYNSGAAGIDSLYTIPNQRVQFHPTKSPLRQGSYRALASTANHFARESHIDELAHEVGLDPLEFRLKNLSNPRLRAVFEAAANKFSWNKRKPTAGHGFGIAGGFEKAGYIAMAVEIAIERGQVRVVRVVSAFDCGAVVNPVHLNSQVEGAVVMGLGGALFEALKFENGRVTNASLSEYQVPRFSDTPELETVLIDRKDQPSVGAGECPIVGLAPAIANAIYSATGQRLRSMPLVPNGLPKVVSQR
ncbi:MAG: xanthine dehydrogenase family protein molybdopterin-binding subunit [Acidobacteria bacterium]|nr:xanthine dehydrogenase family protein molybdopterin-binding subunit [Acidobacteriota bacterium]